MSLFIYDNNSIGGLIMAAKKGGNPKGNPQNLVKNSDRTPEERKELAKKAGKASGNARKRRKTYQEILETLLGKETAPEMVLEAARKMIKDKITVDEALGIVAVAKALNGDFAFWKEIKETLEGKEAQKLELTGKVTLEELVSKVEGKSDY